MSEWRSLVERARRFNPTVADALLGAFLLVVALPQLFIDDPTYRHLGITFRAGSVVGVLLLAAETLPLTWRRRSPRAVLAVLTARPWGCCWPASGRPWPTWAWWLPPTRWPGAPAAARR